MREEELLALFPFGAKLRKQYREALAKRVRHVIVPKGERLHALNEDYGCFYIRKGAFTALLLGETDTETELFRIKRDSICILDYKPVFGRDLSDLAFQSQVTSDIYLIDKETFCTLYTGSRPFAEYAVQSLLAAFPVLIGAIAQRDYYSLEKRIAGVLLSESLRQRSNTVYITHAEIASKIGSAREVVTRKLKEFSEQGLVQCLRGKVVIINKEKLKKGKIEDD